MGWGIQAIINFTKAELANAEVVVVVVVKVVVVLVAGQTEKLGSCALDKYHTPWQSSWRESDIWRKP